MSPLDFRPFKPQALGDLLAGPKWLVDENLSSVAAAKLVIAGHDALAISARPDLVGTADPEVMKIARLEERVLVTGDKDYGKLVFQEKLPAPPGVVILREPELIDGVADLLMWLLLEQPLAGHFLSVRRGRGHGQALPLDRERAARLEAIAQHKPIAKVSFTIPYRYSEALAG